MHARRTVTPKTVARDDDVKNVIGSENKVYNLKREKKQVRGDGLVDNC